MNRVRRAVALWAEAIARGTAGIGRAVAVDRRGVLDRSAELSLGRPGLWSPNGSCRLVRAADGWLAANLPRAEDLDMVPAWIGGSIDAAPWPALIAAARSRTVADLLADAQLLGLAVSAVGERAAGDAAPLHRMAAGGRRGGGPLKVADLSSLWAGPLCAGLLAEAGASVIRYESRARAEASRRAAPDAHARLNTGKASVVLDFADAGDRARLADAVAAADIVVTGARPRAFGSLGLSPAAMFARNPALVWVAITGHGWFGAAGDRIGFGDDAAAAGGLVRYTPAGAPRFLGDALADPLTGLAATVGALEAVRQGGGLLVDAALAGVAAAVARGV